MTDDLAYFGAADALDRFRNLDLSPVELMQAVIAAAEATEPEINAFTDTFFEEALARARVAAAAGLETADGSLFDRARPPAAGSVAT